LRSPASQSASVLIESASILPGASASQALGRLGRLAQLERDHAGEAQHVRPVRQLHEDLAAGVERVAEAAGVIGRERLLLEGAQIRRRGGGHPWRQRRRASRKKRKGLGKCAVKARMRSLALGIIATSRKRRSRNARVSALSGERSSSQ